MITTTKLKIRNRKVDTKSFMANGDEREPSNRGADICPVEYTVVLDKFSVDTMLFELVEEKFNEILPCLLAGVEYTPEELIGYEWWAELTTLSQRQAHLCLKHLATLPETRLTDMASLVSNKTTFCID